MLDIQEAIEEARRKLSEEKSEYKLIVHPNIISYDYRIAWTWEEMERRNEWNITVDGVRILFWKEKRPYWNYVEWLPHWSKQRVWW